MSSSDFTARPLLPVVTNVDIRELALRASGGTSAGLDYIDESGRTVARAIVEIDDLERHAHDLLAMVASARAKQGLPDNVVQLRARSQLMRELRGDVA